MYMYVHIELSITLCLRVSQSERLVLCCKNGKTELSLTLIEFNTKSVKDSKQVSISNNNVHRILTKSLW